MELLAQQKADFLETLWDFYAHNQRATLPWRQPDRGGQFNPYNIMVSEIMLQQTQVARVIPKYQAFQAQFPDIQSLAETELSDVLRAWQGLGYNRRAKFLWQAAQVVSMQGAFPDTESELVKLPGIGVNTAGAILAYAYNKPALFIETNVRTVYIHHFFADRSDVHDKEIKACLEQTIDHEQPREFYWALMDYGSYLKSTMGNLNVASKHYAKQSTFVGSRRQIRGQILRLLGDGPLSLVDLRKDISDERLKGVLDDLIHEGLIRQDRSGYSL